VTNDPAIFRPGFAVSRRAIVRGGARLAYSAPLVTASFGLNSLRADAKKKQDQISSDAGEILEPENTPPTAIPGEGFEVEDEDGDGFETVSVDGSNSTDSDGKIIAYQWMLGNESVADEAVATITLPVGTHRLTLTVTDDKGATASARIRIKVSRGSQSESTADEAPAGESVAEADLPPAPYDVEARQKLAEIAITWKVEDFTPLPHRVYRTIDDGLDRSTDELLDVLDWELIREEWEEKLSYRDATAKAGIPYFYEVRSFDGVNESNRSNVARIIPEAYVEEPAATEPPASDPPAEPTATTPPPAPTATTAPPEPTVVPNTPTPEPVIEDTVAPEPTAEEKRRSEED
jgi:hypothetical protein